MGGVNSADGHSPRSLFGLDPVVVGTACCIVSALGYTATNICLRRLATEADKMWTVCIKEVVTVAVIGPWLLLQAFRARRFLPSFRTLLLLAITGLAVQLAGNLPMQWAFDVVGIAVAIPSVFVVMLISSAGLGLLFLGERISARSVAAIGMLIGSIALLSLGKVAAEGPSRRAAEAAVAGEPAPEVAKPSVAGSSTEDPPQKTSAAVRSLLGVGAGCLAGLMFATLSIVIRFTATARVPVTTIVFIVTGMGVLSLGSLSVRRLGVHALLHTDPHQFAWMLAAGTFNLIAFLAITKGLQLTTVVRANVLNASQVAMLAVAGIVFFQESWNLWVILGATLTVVGILRFGQPSGHGLHEPAPLTRQSGADVRREQ